MPDQREIELPFFKDPLRLGLATRAQHHQHPLLALAQHDLVGRHAGLAHRHPIEVELDAEPALARHLDRGRGQPRGTHILDRDDRVGLHQFEAGLDQQFFGERVADLHGRPLFAGVAAKLGRGHCRTVNAVAPGLGADIDDRVTRSGGGRIEDAVGAGEPDAHRIDQDVAVVGRVELAFAADRRHADAIAVAADAGDDAGHEMAGARMVGAAKAQRIEDRDRPRAHREDIAQNAADAGRRPLIRLDKRWVVVALDLKDNRVAIADIDNSGVFTGSADDLRPRCRQGLEPDL